MTTDGLLNFSRSFPGILEGVVCLFQPDTSFGKIKAIDPTEVFQYFCEGKNGNGLCKGKDFIYVGHWNGLHKFRCVKCNGTVDFCNKDKENLYWSSKPNEVTPE